jgi:polysaccharide export outer membrane protein
MFATTRFWIACLTCLFGLSHTYAAEQDYRLAAGDEIEILVYEESDLSMHVRLSESGVFTYPYLGSITARGKTVIEVKEELTRGLLQDILVDPSVHVSIVAYRKFYIGGEVKRPGGYPFKPGLTIKQAITIAGGLTEWASSSKFEILREGLTEPESASEATLLRPGDTVTVREGLF